MKPIFRVLVLVSLVALVGCGQKVDTSSGVTSMESAGGVSTSETTLTVAPRVPENNQQPPAAGDIIQSHGGPVRNHVSLVEFFRAQGLNVTIGDAVEQPFLRGEGTTLEISGAPLQGPITVQSFDYDDTNLAGNAAAIATEDIASIDSNGTPKLIQVTWVDPPHWFYHERVIVLYLGSDPGALTVLTSALGQQVAGK